MDNQDQLDEIMSRNYSLLESHYTESFHISSYSIHDLRSNSPDYHFYTKINPEIVTEVIFYLKQIGYLIYAIETAVFFDDLGSYREIYKDIINERNLEYSNEKPIEILEHARKSICLFHPEAESALTFKSWLLYEYCMALQPRDLPSGFSFKYYDEIFENIYNQINVNNAGIFYWFFLSSNRYFISKLNEHIEFPDRLITKKGFRFPDFRLCNMQINAMKEFFDSTPYVKLVNESEGNSTYQQSDVVRMNMLSREAYSMIQYYYAEKTNEKIFYALANTNQDSFYLEVFFRQHKVKDFLTFFTQNRNDLAKLIKKYYLPEPKY